jgi:hypothetical protein
LYSPLLVFYIEPNHRFEKTRKNNNKIGKNDKRLKSTFVSLFFYKGVWLCPVSCVPNVASIFGLSILNLPFGFL